MATNLHKIINHTTKLLLLAILVIFAATTVEAQTGKRPFTIVIDAGHGGKDPGALSSNRKLKEKNINLDVALSLGKMINAAYPEIKIVYTRKSDKFVTLGDRAQIANRAKADLFISIHTNAAKSTRLNGCETFTLGSGSNAEAKKAAQYENKVMELEENYRETYKKFNSLSTEDYIVLEMLRTHDIEKSIYCADAIQKNMIRRSKRNNLGVKNAGFYVLHQTNMPSILIELGFISNPGDMKYLSSSAGKQALTKGIFDGFSAYYKQYGHSRNSAKAPSVPVAEPEVEEASIGTTSSTSAPVFKIQILTSDKALKAKDKRLKGVKASYYKENGLYKYTYGSTTDYNEILRLHKNIKSKFKESFIVAFRGDKKISTRTAIDEYKKKKK
ncbi:MAG: N-acetylmuramoyl-L-alanine amidase [Bacteroidaceae bacterium]|nr:N-acetylmuramoyl-L-alanine amidase [Bacteroidaceae bacterium]